jgi:protein phosphatase 1L
LRQDIVFFLASIQGKIMLLSACTAKGKREYQEDRWDQISWNDGKHKAWAVYDGHSGSQVSEYLSKHFLPFLAHTLGPFPPNTPTQVLEKIITNAFLAFDEQILVDPEIDEDHGSTVVLFLRWSSGRSFFINLGDSRGVAYAATTPFHVVAQTRDHKPDDGDEGRRIRMAGGFITYGRCARVNGSLALSRAMGDYNLKPIVTAVPKVTLLPVTKGKIILASDGLWDVFDGEGAKIFGFNEMAAAQLVAQALARQSTDNVTVLVIQF